MNDQINAAERTGSYADQISAAERTDPYAQQVTGVIDKLGAPKPELLWVLLLVIVIEGAQLWESGTRVAAIREWQSEQAAFLATVEEHRQEENRRMQETNKFLAQALSRHTDRVSRRVTEPNTEK